MSKYRSGCTVVKLLFGMVVIWRVFNPCNCNAVVWRFCVCCRLVRARPPTDETGCIAVDIGSTVITLVASMRIFLIDVRVYLCSYFDVASRV